MCVCAHVGASENVYVRFTSRSYLKLFTTKHTGLFLNESFVNIFLVHLL